MSHLWGALYTANIRNAKVTVKYRDQFYIWRNFGSTYTNSAGNWTMSGLTPTANYWEVIVHTESTFANVKNPLSSNNTWLSNTFYNSLSNGSNMNLTVTNNTHINAAFNVYDEVVTLKSFLDNYKNPGSTNNILFDAVNAMSVDGKGDRFSSGTIYLYTNSPNTSTVMHELAHNYMYNLYSNSMPSSNCPSPHFLNQESDTGCAWVEGWAVFLPLLFSNGVYKFPGGSTVNLENVSTYVSGNNGEDVEGRVAAALWDLFDSNTDGFDTTSYSFSNIYRAMWDGKKNNIGEYWSKWTSLGYDSNAKNCFKQSGITYS